MLELIKPTLQYQQAHLTGLRALYAQNPIMEGTLISDETGDGIIPIELPHRDFMTYLKILADVEKGLGLPEGWVPSSHYWLVNGVDFLGHIQLAHSLEHPFLRDYGGHISYAVVPQYRGLGYGTAMLKLVLPHAQALGLTRVLVTCRVSNLPSRRMIEKLGGQYEQTVMCGEAEIARYWLSLEGDQA